MLVVHKCSHFVVKNLSLEMSRSRGFMAEYGDHIEFLYNNVFKTYAPGMRIGRADGPGYRAIGNVLIRPNCKTMGSKENDELGVIRRNPPCEGMDVGTLLDFEIAHNEICWGDKEAMLIDGSSENGEVHHNYVHDLYNRPWVGGIGPNGYGDPRNLDIHHNIIHDVGGALGVGNEGGGHTRDIKIHHNVVFDTQWVGIAIDRDMGIVENIRVYNNTIHHCGYLEGNNNPAGGIALGGGGGSGPKNVHIFHNILTDNRDYHLALIGDASLQRDNIVFERNLINTAVNNTWGTRWIAHHGDRPIRSGPGYVDAESLDFRLQPGSPAIDAGLLGIAARDGDGTPPELGAFAFGRPPVPIPPAGEGFVLRINAGCTEEFTDSQGRTWKKDPWRRGVGTYGADAGEMVERGEVQITNTPVPHICRFERYGFGTYTVKVPPGLYRVVLHFAETWHREAGQRVFDVLLNGRPMLEDFDVFREAGNSAFAAVVRSGKTKAYEEIVIGFRAKKDSALINGIEIIQVTKEE
jgi:hypothetical protein